MGISEARRVVEGRNTPWSVRVEGGESNFWVELRRAAEDPTRSEAAMRVLDASGAPLPIVGTEVDTRLWADGLRAWIVELEDASFLLTAERYGLATNTRFETFYTVANGRVERALRLLVEQDDNSSRWSEGGAAYLRANWRIDHNGTVVRRWWSQSIRMDGAVEGACVSGHERFDRTGLLGWRLAAHAQRSVGSCPFRPRTPICDAPTAGTLGCEPLTPRSRAEVESE